MKLYDLGGCEILTVLSSSRVRDTTIQHPLRGSGNEQFYLRSYRLPLVLQPRRRSAS